MDLQQAYLAAVVLAALALTLADKEAKKLWERLEHLDPNHDGVVTEQELKDFAFWERMKDLREDAEEQWTSLQVAPGDKLTFDWYKQKSYTDDYEDDLGPYGRTVQQDHTRFNASDQNKDGALDKEEFLAFLWAEEYPHMHDLITLETIEDLDMNGDGALNYNEYRGEGDGGDFMEDFEGDMEFKEFDKDEDGQLSHAEVKEWILGPTLDIIKEDEEKVATVLSKLDKDEDGKLTRSEIEADPEVIETLRYDEDDDAFLHDEF
ncbi:CALU [Branchiostoma lanceolatum]|uniref:Reticulocalbin-3 n=1 Tax=Branchiostoma lanceolatum TaxID=7740 RepID=A0A8K0ELL0_BRALA|nr:CALU [Branchiostoma lanceolatum]